MATPPQGNLPANPTIPLTPEVRAAYQDLYDKIQAALDSTMDAATVEALNTWQPEVDQVLRKDDLYKLSADTASSSRELESGDSGESPAGIARLPAPAGKRNNHL